MLGSIKTTVVLLSVLVLTVISSAPGLRNQGQPQAQDVENQRLIEEQKRKEEIRSHFPVVDYDAPENPDPKERSKRKEKNKHFDKKNLVSDDPTPQITAVSEINHGRDLPALPVSQSGLIVIGEVLTSQAYLSNDKSGVYTELTVSIHDVLKNTPPVRVNKGDVVTMEREGGIVRYPNGHQRLYQMAGEGMPTVARQYVLFLRAMEESETYYLLAGYELSPGGVLPVDSIHRFRAYKGYDTEAFLSSIRSAIQQAQQAPVN